jgi:hypothetical protein
MPFDIIAVITGVGESRQESKGSDCNGTQVTLELDPRLPLSVEGDLTKVCMKPGGGSRAFLTLVLVLLTVNRSHLYLN